MQVNFPDMPGCYVDFNLSEPTATVDGRELTAANLRDIAMALDSFNKTLQTRDNEV